MQLTSRDGDESRSKSRVMWTCGQKPQAGDETATGRRAKGHDETATDCPRGKTADERAQRRAARRREDPKEKNGSWVRLI